MSRDVTESRTIKRQARRLRKGRVAILLAVIFIIAGAVYTIFGGKSQSVGGLIAHSQGRINVLVLGVDEREDDVGRSDTAFVVTIDTDAKKITMLSIPRDSRVKISGHGWDKINHAYAFGGSKLSKTTVENLLGISIDYTAVVNFNGFVRMIDAIGGVTVDVDKPMKYADPYDDDGGLYIDLKPGTQKLDGKTAIEYVRYRDEEGDIGRVARQQKFLKALTHEFVKPQLITRLPELVKEFATAIRTDMPTNEMIRLIPVVSEAATAGLDTEWVSGTPIWIQDVSYWLPDIKELRAKVAQIQGITVDEKYALETERLANEYKQSVPREIKVADVPPVVKQSIQRSSGATQSVVGSNKSKAESIPANGKNNSGSKTASTVNNRTSSTDGSVHKNTTADAAGK